MSTAEDTGSKKSFLLVANVCIIFSKYIKDFHLHSCSSEEVRTRSALQLHRIYVSYAEHFNTIMPLWMLQTFHFNTEAFSIPY